jgi:hypothetical protein
MTISGNTYRNIVRDNKFSAELGLSFQNCTGASEFGFSGESKTYKFSFISGKAFDHENRYFSSYLPNSQLNISTNLSGEAYDYSVDGDRVVYSGYKQNFFAERFYFKTTGCNIDASLTIKAQKPTCVLNIPANFYSGQLITGYVTTNSLSGIRVFSGSFENQSSFYFNNINTGYIKSNTSGEVLIGQNVTGLGNFITNFTLNTSAGDYNQQVSGTGLAAPYLDYAFEIDSDLDIINNLSTQTFESGVEKIGSANLNYSYDTNYGNLTPSSLPIDISLSYYTGVTGYFGQVSDVSIVSGGYGYLSPPTIIFSGGSPTYSASATALLGSTSVDYTSVVGINMIDYGSGYSSVPTVLFSGGTGVVNNLSPSVASGIAKTSFYIKSFSGFFNLVTGINSSFINYRDNSYVSGFSYRRTGSSISDSSIVNITTSYTPSFDNEIMVAKLSISGVNNNLIERYITGAK